MKNLIKPNQRSGDSFSATLIAHWPTGPVYVCDEHAKQIVNVGCLIGTHVAVTDAEPGHECSNCISESLRVK